MNSTLLLQKIVPNLFKKKTVLWSGLFLLLFSSQVQGQINAYQFEESNTALTYTPIIGTVLFASGWDENVANVALPFTFNYNGVNYTTTNVSSNGFITFGATAPGININNPLSNAAAYAGAISAFGQNILSGSASSAVRYATVGTSPNRVFIVQYNDAARTLANTGLVNFQIHLYETSNIIEVWYDVPTTDPTSTGAFGAARVQLGLRGVNSAWPLNVFNRKEVTATAPLIPTANGTANTSSIVYNANTFNTQVTRFRWSPPCYAPSALTATNLTGTTADISWTAPPIAPSGYQFEVRSSGAPGSGPAGLGDSGSLAGTSTTATGLTEGFTYTLYVRSTCGGSNNSAWITGSTFTLPCAATTVPYFITFDPIADGFTVPAMPVCTVNDNAGLGNNWVTTPPDFGIFFDEHLTYTFSFVNAANTWFITKPVTLTAGTTYRIQYLYGGSSENTTITNRMEVRYGTTGTAAGLAGAIQLDDHPEIKSVPENNVVHFTAPTTDTYYFGFRAYSAANNGTLYLDDIFIDFSTCLIPTGLTAPPALVSFNNATITWTAPTPSPASGYAYYVNTSGVAPTNSTPASGTVPAGTTLTVIPGLSPSTTYYVWVRSNCGPGEFGEWSASTTFTTLPPPPVYCIPAGTSIDGQGITNVTFGSINNTTGNEFATSYYGDYSGLTANVAQGATIPVAITFNTAPFNYNTHIWIDWNNDGDFFDTGELVYTGLSGTSNPSVLNASFTVPLTQPLGPRRMRIGGTDFGPFANPCRTDSWQSYEDYTINVIVAPPALTLSQNTMPAQCGLTNSPLVTITSNIADFDVYTWTPSTGVTGTPATGFTFNTSATTTYILTASQTSGSFSTNTVSFTYLANETPTPITIATPDGTDSCLNGPAIELNAAGGIVSNVTVFQDNFNSGINGPGQFIATNSSTGGANPANAAWTVRPSGYNSGPPSWFATFNSNDNTDFVLTNSDSQGGSPAPSTTRTRLTSPVIDLTSYTAATLNFFHHFRSWVNDDFVRVQITTNGGSTWTDIANYTTTQGTPSNFTQVFLNLNPYVGNNIQIRFDYQSRWGWGWAIDNFRILGSATSDIVWTPATGLYSDAAATIPYVAGTGTSVVYAMPSTDTVYTATATAPGPTFCESTQTVAIAVTPQVGGTLSGNQVSCDTSSYTDITLTGHVGTILRWEYADDAAFTVGVTPIANTTTTLTPAEFGTFTTIRYFRAVVGTGACNPVYSTVASVSTNTTVLTGTNTWSNGLPDITKRVIIDGNYTATANFSACSLIVRPARTLTVQSGVTITVENEVSVEGATPNTVIFENNASLIQLTDAVNTGSIRYERNTTPVVFHDYTYWSSPVANQTLATFSPDTAPNRFYVFNNATYSWQNISTASVMEAARGYIIRAPGTFSATVPSVFTGAFYGVPHNGPYSRSITVAGAQNRNLLGNPYPSAIDADLLYAANNTVLQGNFFFWTHNTPITANVYNANDYATYNATGGTGTAATTTGVNTTVPNGNIAAGQGFFVQGLASGTVNFENTMRLTGLNNNFYRSANAPQINVVEKHRLWLNIINQQGAYKQMLLGYIEGATNAIDNGFDAEVTEAGNVVSLYSLNSNKKLTIQGRALPFDINDEVPLGFRTTIPGNFAIELENFDGLFEEGQTIYLEDKWLNIVHNLNESNYNFTTEVGTFDDRFEVQFIDETLSVNNPTEASNAIVVYKNNETIFVHSSTLDMKDVRLFDARGRLITEKIDINAAEVQFTNLNVANQLILVQITTQEGTVVTKKVAY